MSMSAMPALANSSEVAELADAAKSAKTSLDKATENKSKADKSHDKSESKQKKAKKRLAKAENAVAEAADKLEAVTAEAEITQEEIARALAELDELRRDEGVVDLAARAGDAITGESDSDLLTAAGSVFTAGLAAVVGPAVQVFSPAAEAANDWVEEADREFFEAHEHVKLLESEIVSATEAERAAKLTLLTSEWATAQARADFRDAKKSTKKASAKADDAADERAKAKKAAKKATKKLREAEAEAEKKRKAKAKKKAEAEKKKKAEAKKEAERSAAASAGTRSMGDGRTVRPATGHITSPYGMRTHPITGVYKLHSGTDFSAGDGRAYAARSGTVAAVTYDGAYGNMVTLSHGDGIQTRYAHLASASVSNGQSVAAGDVVGQIGSTGSSTGPHLHFEVLKNGEFINSASWLGL